MRTLGFAVLCFLVLAALPTAANADSFTLTGPNLTITFSLPGTGVTNPTSLFSGTGGISQFSGFQINNIGIVVTLNGIATTMTENIAFFTDGTGGTVANGGGLAIGLFNGSTPDLVNEMGPQLFTIISLTNPFFATFPSGPHSLTVCPPVLCGFTPSLTSSNLTLTITSPTPAVPEPSSMLLLGTGLVGLGGLVRRKLRG